MLVVSDLHMFAVTCTHTNYKVEKTVKRETGYTSVKRTCLAWGDIRFNSQYRKQTNILES